MNYISQSVLSFPWLNLKFGCFISCPPELTISWTEVDLLLFIHEMPCFRGQSGTKHAEDDNDISLPLTVISTERSEWRNL